MMLRVDLRVASSLSRACFGAGGVRPLSNDVAKQSSRIFTTDERRRRLIEEALRVDHAGEYGAVRIYEGQMAVLGRTAAGPLIEVRCDISSAAVRGCWHAHSVSGVSTVGARFRGKVPLRSSQLTLPLLGSRGCQRKSWVLL